MIELYRAANDAESDRVEEALRDLVVAHRVITCTPEQATSQLGGDVTLPALREDEQIAHGPEEIARFLEQTRTTLEGWNKFQTDACYLDDEGNVC